MNDFFDNRRILDIIWKRRIHFVIIGILAVIIPSVFSGPAFIKPKFKATAKVYPTNLGSLSEESHTEQMLEIISSTDLKLRMFDAFDLDQVYKVSREEPKYLSYMLGIYGKNVSARKTDFETVQITVLDADPQRAALMCDSIIHFYNGKVREMHSAKNWELARVVSDNIRMQSRERDSLKLVLDGQREKYKVFDVILQSTEVTRGYMKALAEGRGNTADGKEIKKIYDNLMEMGSEIHMTERRFESLMQSINQLKVLYDNSVAEAQKKITYSMVVEKPVVPDDKAFPKRWLIVAMSLASALFLALVVFTVLDFNKPQ